jgi:hypothetical protein
MRKLTFASCVIVAVWGIGLHGLRGTDFSGSWVLDDGFKPSDVIARRLTVEQPITTKDALGAPAPPEYRALIVKRHFADRTQEDTYPIDLDSEAARRPIAQSRQTRLVAVWMGASYLQLEHKVFSASGASERSPRTETWRFDDGSRLVISVVTNGPGTVDSRVVAYRRDGK